MLDYDGNGSTDFTLEAKVGEEVVFDITPPEARISFSTSTQSFTISGIDEISSTTVLTTATSSTITDEAGNTLEIVFSKIKQKGREIKIEIKELIYNGALIGNVSENSLQYEWSVDKSGNIKELEEKTEVASLKVKGHYDAKKNVTKIKTKLGGGEGDDEDEKNKKTFPGLVIINLTTDRGRFDIGY